MIVAAAVLRFRRARSLKQADLAELAGVSQSYLCTIEQGTKVPSLEMLSRLATALEMPLWTFLVGEGSPAAADLVDKLLARVPDIPPE